MGDFVQDPYLGSAPGPHWETYVPQTSWPCPTTWTPSIVKSWVRRVCLLIHHNRGVQIGIPDDAKCVTEILGRQKN